MPASATYVALQKVPHAVCDAALTWSTWSSSQFRAECVFPTASSPFWCARSMPSTMYSSASSLRPWQFAARLSSWVAAMLGIASWYCGLPVLSSRCNLWASLKKAWLRAAVSASTLE